MYSKSEECQTIGKLNQSYTMYAMTRHFRSTYQSSFDIYLSNKYYFVLFW